MTVTENEVTATETTDAPAKPKVKRRRRTPAELKAGRVAKAQREVERLEKSGESIQEKAKAAAAKAAAAKAKADEYQADLDQARRTLAWEQAKPVKGENTAPESADVEDDQVDGDADLVDADDSDEFESEDGDEDFEVDGDADDEDNGI